MGYDGAVTEAVRTLLLPIDPDREKHAVKAVSRYLTNAGVAESDHAAVVRLELSRWRDDGSPSSRLRHIVSEALQAGDLTRGSEVAREYFSIHRELTSSFLLSFEEARGLLSHLRLALHMLEHERMSCAQVARVIEARRRGARHTWQQIEEMCRRFTKLPRIDLDEVTRLHARDTSEEADRFADANLADEIALIARAGADLGFPEPLEEPLRAFVEPEPAGSLLIVLHFATIIAEYYDHPLSATYELSPRGEVVRLLKTYHPSYEASENPFLNVAKGVPALDTAWAWGRKPSLRSRTYGLVRLLEGLERMGFAARRELATWLRQWLLRIEGRLSERVRQVPGVTSEDQVKRLLDFVMSSNTQTHGIVEQRLVDALTEFTHPRDGGWFARGIGDSVNASNVGRRKLGDCEYEHPRNHRVYAYEAHGGRLASVYVEGHLRSLGAVLASRRDDLAAVAQPDLWELRICFVAHELASLDEVAAHRTIGEFEVAIEFIDYKELVSRAEETTNDGDLYSALIGPINARVIGPLNEPWTPQHVRDRVLAVIDADYDAESTA